MKEKEIKKMFFEERTKTYHHTLCEAKKAHRFSYVWRVWLKDKTIRCTVRPIPINMYGGYG